VCDRRSLVTFANVRAVPIGAFVLCVLFAIACGPRVQAPADLSGPVRGATRPAKLGALPEDVAIVFTSMRWRSAPRGFVNWELYARDLAGAHVAQITFDGQSHQHAAVAPDHRHVATNRMPKEPWNDLELWVLDLAEQSETRFVPGFASAGNGGVDWDPHGWLYFAARPTRRDSFDLFRARLDGSAIEQLTQTPEDDYDVSVSDDGARIAWVRVQGRTPFFRKTEIWVARADGRDPVLAYDGGPESGRHGGFPLGGYDPEFSPDGRRVVFSHTDPEHDNFDMGAHSLWTGATDGSGAQPLHARTGSLRMIPDWRGDTILFTEYDQFEQYVGLATMRADGTDVRRLDTGLRDAWDGGRHGKFVPAFDPAWPHAEDAAR
jgi:Tol biopolymer transport system component